jgi:glycosyltransferase involved in cell wall biosynthesis
MDQNTKLKVSIMMCAYNRAHFLPQAIESVLMQNFKDWELLVLDDASTDNTQELMSLYIKDSRIRYIRHSENLGLAKNRNAGVNESQGEYLAILDSDDYWTDTNKLTTQVEFLDQNPKYGLIGSFGKIVDEKDEKVGELCYKISDDQIRKRILGYHQFLHSSVMFRKSSVNEAEGYDENLAPAEDYDLILKIGTKHKMHNIPESMVNYRIHTENSSSNDRRKKMHHALLHLRLVKKYRKNYPNFLYAIIKAYARLPYAWIKS